MSLHTRPYFQNLERMLARCPDDGAKAICLNEQLTTWENREQRLARWAASPCNTSNPFGDLDAFTCATVRAELGRLLATLRDKIKARIEEAEKVLAR